MKHRFLFTLCFCAMSGLSAYAQKVTIHFQKVKLEKVFGEITRQTGLTVAYSQPTVNPKRIVSVNANKEELNVVLTRLFAGTGIVYEIGKQKIYLKSAQTQSKNPSGKKKTVKGKVVDANGDPIIGASVKVNGMSIGTITDIDGNYSLEGVPEGSSLDISYIGYKNLNLRLDKVENNPFVTLEEDAKVLDEVVVVGYGTQNKKTLTGAVSMVNMGDVEMNAVSNVSRALAGKAAGFRVNTISAQPGGEAKFRIRGEASTGAGNEPLFVIDGFPVSSSGSLTSGNNFYEAGNIDNVLESLNPDDIESISVLKDAASTAIYGARAGHGVVLITTKRGKNQKPRVTYSGVGSVQIARSNYKMLDTRMYMDMYNKQQYEEWMKMNGLGIYEGYVGKSDSPTLYKPTFNNDQILNASGTDWLDAVMRNGYMQQHNLSVNGGTEKTRYLASVNYMSQEGIVKNNGTDRLSVRLNLDQEISKYVSFGITATYSRNNYDNVPLGDKQNEYSGILTGAIQSNPTIPIYDSGGNYFIDPKRPFVANPVSLLEIKDKTEKDRLIGAAFVTVKPIKDLEVKYQLGADRSSQKRSSYWPKTTLQGKNYNGKADISQEMNTTYLMELTAQYSKAWNGHQLKFLGGYSFQKFKTEGFNAGNSDFLVDGFGYNNIGSGNYKKPSVGSWASINSIASLFARANYSFGGKYLLEATLRADAASNFAPENRWGYFPSVSAGWMISEEKFMKNCSNWLSMLKLRTSYGQTGNSNVGYRIYDYYEVGKNSIIGGAESLGVYASDLGNRQLTWETTSEFNVGLDFGIINNRFKLTVEYFKRKITDLLVSNKSLPFYNEVNRIAANVGSTQSKGVELTLNTVNFVTKNFDWNTTFTLSHYDDRWRTRDANWKPRAYEKADDPIRAWWTYEAIGILRPGEKVPNAQKDLVPGMMKLKDQNEDGVLGDEDMVYIGNGDPKVIYGLNNAFRYKNFDLNIYFYGEAGRKRGASYYEGWTRMDNGINVSTYSLNSFSSNNLTATDPTYVRGGSGWGNYYVKSIYYIRCGNITLGYKIPINPKVLKNLRVYVDVSNPFIITNWTGLDPETDNGTFAYPNVTSFNFGVSASF